MKKIKDNKKKWKLYKKVLSSEGDWLTRRNPEIKNIYLDYVNITDGFIEMENFVFSATLIPLDYYRGRSAAGFYFTDTNNHGLYTMKIKSLNELVKNIALGKIKVKDGGFEGLFTFEKQGANYSLVIYEESGDN